MAMTDNEGDSSIPVTCFTGFLGAGKTTTILGLLKQLPKDYKVVLLKNEYGDVEVDSLLAEQSQITGVSEILNGCMCCTMVGLVENALIEIKERFHPDRIIIESSGSAFPATLALQIRQLEPKGFKLDGIVTVIDCQNFTGYEDSSPSAKLQARYTDLLLLSKHELVSERDMDILMDHLGTLNDDTPRIQVSRDKPVDPSVVFGLDTTLFLKKDQENVDWEQLGGGSGWHGDEVETKTIWKGGRKPGNTKKRKRVHGGHDHDQHDHTSGQSEHTHVHANGEDCHCHDHSHDDLDGEKEMDTSAEVEAIDGGKLEDALGRLNFEIYRVKGIVRIASKGDRGWETHILNYAFGRHELVPYPALDDHDDLAGVSLRLTIMGERGEVAPRARKLAQTFDAEIG